MRVIGGSAMGAPRNGRDELQARGPASWTVGSTEIDTSVSHPARRYDYWLGGKDNFAADRAAGDAVAAMFPTVRTAIRENRRFLGRAVRFLAEAGIEQYLDIGTGIPSADNTHEVAQRIAPASRIVYVDNDPIVLAHARALLTSAGAEGATAYIHADLRRPAEILAHPTVAETLDLRRPVALVLVAVVHFLTDDDGPHEIVAELLDALPSGSYLALSHATHDHVPPQSLAQARENGIRAAEVWTRGRDECVRFFDGLDLVPPGVVSTAQWRADGEPFPRPSVEDVATHAAVGRKP